MASRQASCCGRAPGCLWLLGLFLLMDASARPANHSSAREKAGRRENEILPPDHLNGVKLEMDGHLNKDFHQEVFLGKEAGAFEDDAEPRKSRRKLMLIFSRWARRPPRPPVLAWAVTRGRGVTCCGRGGALGHLLSAGSCEVELRTVQP